MSFKFRVLKQMMLSLLSVVTTTAAIRFLSYLRIKISFNFNKYPTVKQYDPIRNRWIENEDPIQYLQEHIIRGDRSDGIPNILTCDDAIVNGKMQKKMSKEKISALASMDPADFTNYIRLRNWKRNSELIDFAKIPRPIVDNIIMTYNKYRANTSIDIQYFIDNNIQDLIEEFS